MTADSPASGWCVGDRVTLRLANVANRGRYEWVTGTVAAVDPPEYARPGVLVKFDSPFMGLDDCFATHRELVRTDR